MSTGRIGSAVGDLKDEFPSVSFPPRARLKDSIAALKALMPDEPFVARARVGDTVDTMEGVVSVALAISGTPETDATENSEYAGFTASATGGVSPYVFSLTGTWPDGIDIDADTGEVSGTPTEAGSFTSLSVRVTDNRGVTDDLDTFTLTVASE